MSKDRTVIGHYEWTDFGVIVDKLHPEIRYKEDAS